MTTAAQYFQRFAGIVLLCGVWQVKVVFDLQPTRPNFELDEELLYAKSHNCGGVTMEQPTQSGLGNAMFAWATLLAVSEDSRRMPFLTKRAKEQLGFLDGVFHLPEWPERAINSSHYRQVQQDKPSVVGEELAQLRSLPCDGSDVLLDGWFQAPAYFQPHAYIVGEAFSNFHREVGQQCSEILMRLLMEHGRERRLVCVHLRRGDVTDEAHKLLGWRGAEPDFAKRAIQHFRRLIASKMSSAQTRSELSKSLETSAHNASTSSQSSSRPPDPPDASPLFLVLGNQPSWNRRHVPPDKDVVVLDKHGDGVDLCLLSKCWGVAVSTGTFGWWGAWLSGGEVLYQRDFARPNSLVRDFIDEQSYFPSQWTAI